MTKKFATTAAICLGMFAGAVSAQTTNWLQNPDFDSGLVGWSIGWTTAAPYYGTVSWSPGDARGRHASGSAVLEARENQHRQGFPTLSQCVALPLSRTGDTHTVFLGKFKADSSFVPEGVLTTAKLSFYDSRDCTGVSSSTKHGGSASGGYGWRQSSNPYFSELCCGSVRVTITCLPQAVGQTGYCFADDLFFGPEAEVNGPTTVAANQEVLYTATARTDQSVDDPLVLTTPWTWTADTGGEIVGFAGQDGVIIRWSSPGTKKVMATRSYLRASRHVAVNGGSSAQLRHVLTASSGAVVYATSLPLGSAELSDMLSQIVAGNVAQTALTRGLRVKSFNSPLWIAASLFSDFMSAIQERHDPLRIFPIAQNLRPGTRGYFADFPQPAATFSAIVGLEYLETDLSGFDASQYGDGLAIAVLRGESRQLLTADELRSLPTNANYLIIPAAGFDAASFPPACVFCAAGEIPVTVLAVARRCCLLQEFNADASIGLRIGAAAVASGTLRKGIATRVMLPGTAAFASRTIGYELSPASGVAPTAPCRVAFTIRDQDDSEILSSLSAAPSHGVIELRRHEGPDVIDLTPDCDGMQFTATATDLPGPRRRAVGHEEQ